MRTLHHRKCARCDFPAMPDGETLCILCFDVSELLKRATLENVAPIPPFPSIYSKPTPESPAMPHNTLHRFSFDEKYELRFNDETCVIEAYRNGEPWREFVGDKLMHCIVTTLVAWREALHQKDLANNQLRTDLAAKAGETAPLFTEIGQLKRDLEGLREQVASAESITRGALAERDSLHRELNNQLQEKVGLRAQRDERDQERKDLAIQRDELQGTVNRLQGDLIEARNLLLFSRDSIEAQELNRQPSPDIADATQILLQIAGEQPTLHDRYVMAALPGLSKGVSNFSDDEVAAMAFSLAEACMRRRGGEPTLAPAPFYNRSTGLYEEPVTIPDAVLHEHRTKAAKLYLNRLAAQRGGGAFVMTSSDVIDAFEAGVIWARN